MRAVESTQCATAKKTENKQADFPIVALEMLTQRVPQIHCDYLQPHATNTDSTKTSPLALLAATCSSIGRTDTEKGRESYSKTLSPKTTSKADDLKSSFKPYKQEFKFPSFPKPVSDCVTTTSMTSAPYGYSYCHSRFPTGLTPSEIEKERNANCVATPYFDSTREMNVHSMMKCHPSHLNSSKTSPFVTQEHECTHCNAARGASVSLHSQNASVAAAAAVAAARGSGMCPCGLCAQMRGHSEGNSSLKPASQMCQYQSMYSNMKTVPSAVCRDPHCQNCAKFPQHPSAGLQNYIHPALLHQCTHGGKPGQTLLPGTGSPGGIVSDAYIKSKPPVTHPFVCNWVADNKHCGKSFINSEELLQHLRSHTSLVNSQNQSQSPCGSHDVPLPHQLPQPSCTIHGCPCRLGKSPGRQISQPGPYPPYPTGNAASLRYHPYGGLGPSASNTPSSYSYLPHGMFHY